jgi:inorganic pyrophosphatase
VTDVVVDVVVETPMGSRNKYEMDHDSGRIRLDRRLPSATVYPADYGYVPETLALDGDPLDVLVIVEDRTFPGCIVRARLLGVFKMSDEKGVDAKLITVPLHDPIWSRAHELADVPEAIRAEIGHFFEVYKDLEDDKSTTIEGFFGKKAAIDELADARRRYAQTSR